MERTSLTTNHLYIASPSNYSKSKPFSTQPKTKKSVGFCPFNLEGPPKKTLLDLQSSIVPCSDVGTFLVGACLAMLWALIFNKAGVKWKESETEEAMLSIHYVDFEEANGAQKVKPLPWSTESTLETCRLY